MANSSRRLPTGSPRETRETARDRTRRLLNTDPTLPRALIDMVFASGDAGSARPSRRPVGAPAQNVRRRPAVPRRLPSAITVEMPPNIVYRRFPLVTSLLIELDELRRAGALPPPRRGR